MQTSNKPQFDFVRWRWHALVLSTLIVIAGLYIVGTRGLKKGVDFEGGTVVILAFDQAPDYDRIRGALAGDTVVQRYGPEENHHVMIRVKRTGHETGLDLAQEAKAIVQTLKTANVGAFNETPVGTKIVGPVVGEQLRRQGLMATVLAMAGILAYIALRFQFSFAVGAIVATLHDLLICLAFLTFFRYDLTLNVIAGLLTMTRSSSSTASARTCVRCGETT
jgi:preprotein translocase subunit SecF